jgi:cobalt-precorrin 5A hydrolase
MNVFAKVSDELPAAWNNYGSIICIMSCGIVVRTVAPLLEDKTCDPAVVVLDENGRFAISLLSGHLGGANELARKAAAITGGQAVITTASDLQGKPAIDLIARKAGLGIENPRMLSSIASAILDDESIWVFDPEGILSRHLPGDYPFECIASTGSAEDMTAGLDEIGLRSGETEKSSENLESRGNTPGIWVSEFMAAPGLQCLLLRPSSLVVGIGCNRGTTCGEITEFVERVFRESRLSLLSIRNFSSLDIKADERGLLEAAEGFGRPIYFYSREEIAGIKVPNPSDMVARHIGAESVCEASALWSAGMGKLLVPKRKSGNCTVAIARADSP